MRGLDLEPSDVLLEHVRTRLGVLAHELAAAGDTAFEDCLWWASAELSELRAVIEVLLARQTLSRLRRADGQQARGIETSNK